MANNRILEFQRSYGRAAAAVLLWLWAFIAPIAGVPKLPLTGHAAGGLTFTVIFLTIGVRELINALRARIWSDIVAFGLAPALVFLGSIAYMHFVLPGR